MRVWPEATRPSEDVLAPYRQRPIKFTAVGLAEHFASAVGEPPRMRRPLPTLIVCGGMGHNSRDCERFVPGVVDSDILVVWFDQAVSLCALRCSRLASGLSHCCSAEQPLLLPPAAAPRQLQAAAQDVQHARLHGRRGAGRRGRLPARLWLQQQHRDARLLSGRPGGAGGGVRAGAAHPGRGEWVAERVAVLRDGLSAPGIICTVRGQCHCCRLGLGPAWLHRLTCPAAQVVDCALLSVPDVARFHLQQVITSGKESHMVAALKQLREQFSAGAGFDASIFAIVPARCVALRARCCSRLRWA